MSGGAGRGRHPSAPPADGATGVWSTSERAHFTGGNEVLLLRGGDELFPAMEEAIAQARRDVWLATYIFHDDAAARRMADALVRCAERGVRVRVVVDAFGSRATLAELQARLAPAGVALAVFRPFGSWLKWFQPWQLRRLHQKLCAVDGEVAFVGGVNLIDDRLDLRHGLTAAPRLDFSVRLRGPIVEPIEQAVRAVWTRAWLGRDFSAELRSIVRSAAPMERVKGIARRLRMPRGGGATRAEPLPPVRAAFVLRDNLRQRRSIERAYVDAIRHARDRIDLVSPYFYPGHAFRNALRRAAARGVRVRLLLQGKLDYRIAGLAARVLYAELLAAGVEIFEYTPAFLHAKVGLVDGEWATVGSSNIDPLSLLLNLEANVVLCDRGFSAALTQRFEEAVADSRRIGHADYAGRGLRSWFARAIVAWGAYVYLRVGGKSGRY